MPTTARRKKSAAYITDKKNLHLNRCRFSYFHKVLDFAKLLDAVRTDVLAVECHKALGALAEDTGRLILTENNAVSINIYL